MKIGETRPKALHLVLLYDQIAVHSISLDSIKSSTGFKTITLLPDQVMGGVVVLSDETNAQKVTIQPNRLEFIDETEEPFINRKLEEFNKLLQVLPQLAIKAYGINFVMHVTPESGETAGRFLAKSYIKDSSDIETRLKQPILSASIRLFLGTQDHHRDLRLTPIDFSSKELTLQYHLHRDTPISDAARLKQHLEASLLESIQECDDWVRHQLP